MNYFDRYYSCVFGTAMTRMGFGGVLARCNHETIRQENVDACSVPMTREGQCTIYVNERCSDCPLYLFRYK